MKKVLALALALVMALSMSAMAFAADAVSKCGICGSQFTNEEDFAAHVAECEAPTPVTTVVVTPTNACPQCGREFASENEYNAHIQICDGESAFRNSCPKCGREFASENEFNAHVEKCTFGDEKDYVDLTVKEILTMIIDIVKASMSQWDSIEGVVIRLVDFIENMGTLAVSEAEVKGAVADLEAALADAKIPGVEDLLNALKQKIKDLYAGEVATTVVEETTAAEEIVETGSSSVGIAVFAAVSVAAAAAYVCTKKSK